MIGDSPEHDVAGANAMGLSTLLVRTGIHHHLPEQKLLQVRLTAQAGQRQNCCYLVSRGWRFLLSSHRSLLANGVISSVTDTRFAGPADRVGGLPPKGRGLYIRGAFHG
jgi:hypothetical protein